MRSDPYLKRLYREYNRRYFHGELPKDTIVRWRTRKDKEVLELSRREMATTVKSPTPNRPLEILMNRRMVTVFGWGVAKFTLFHEMAHVRTDLRDDHGPVWEREMVRLALAGAFAKGGARKEAPLW